MLKVLVVGAKGMLGQDLAEHLRARGHDTTEVDLPDLDITLAGSLRQLERRDPTQFDWVVNCAAYTAVDQAESEVARANAVNAIGPGALAFLCASKGWRFLHLSTDFVFDGLMERPYREDDEPHPLGVYGKSKRLGEVNVLRENPQALVCRTAWLYGPKGKSFPRTIIEAWKVGKPLRVVADQVGSPTYTGDLARVLADLIDKAAPGGLYHTAGPEPMSWHEFATLACTTYRDLVLQETRPVEIAAIESRDWPTPAPRPAYSVLDSSKVAELGVAPMPAVAESLASFVRRLG